MTICVGKASPSVRIKEQVLVDNESFQTRGENCGFQPCGFVLRERSKFGQRQHQLKYTRNSKP